VPGGEELLTERQNKLLKIIVDEYIKLARPVGSKLICKRLKCSSATIRNEMAELEEKGYLEKTHTSSGRIPSEEGYRYYVDYLMEAKKMNGEDMLKLQILFSNQQLAMSDTLEKSLALISEMTNYTSIVLGKASHENKLKEVRTIPVTDTEVVVIVVTDKGFVEHKNITFDSIDLEEVTKTVNLINDLVVGTPIDEVSSKLEFEVKPIIGRYVKEHELIYNTFYEVFRDFSKKNINIVGKNNILEQPEFNNIEKIKDLFTKFDQEQMLQSIEEEDGDINIYIGKENTLDSDVTVIKTHYKTDKDEGTIAIVGPKRMDYERVVAILEFIKQNLEK